MFFFINSKIQIIKISINYQSQTYYYYNRCICVLISKNSWSFSSHKKRSTILKTYWLILNLFLFLLVSFKYLINSFITDSLQSVMKFGLQIYHNNCPYFILKLNCIRKFKYQWPELLKFYFVQICYFNLFFSDKRRRRRKQRPGYLIQVRYVIF